MQDGGDSTWITLALTLVATTRAVRLARRSGRGERVPVWAWIALPMVITAQGGLGGAIGMWRATGAFALGTVDQAQVLAVVGICHAHNPVVLALACVAATLAASAVLSSRAAAAARSSGRPDDGDRQERTRASSGLCGALAGVAACVGWLIHRDNWIWMTHLAQQVGRPSPFGDAPPEAIPAILGVVLALAVGGFSFAPYARRGHVRVVRLDLIWTAALILVAVSLCTVGLYPGASLLKMASEGRVGGLSMILYSNIG